MRTLRTATSSRKTPAQCPVVSAQAEGCSCHFIVCSFYNSKAEHPSQRHRNREGTDTDCHREGAALSAPIQDSAQTQAHRDTGTQGHIPSSSRAGTGRRSQVQHTPHTAWAHKHKHPGRSPESSMVPLPTLHSCLDPVILKLYAVILKCLFLSILILPLFLGM